MLIGKQIYLANYAANFLQKWKDNNAWATSTRQLFTISNRMPSFYHSTATHVAIKTKRANWSKCNVIGTTFPCISSLSVSVTFRPPSEAISSLSDMVLFLQVKRNTLQKKTNDTVQGSLGGLCFFLNYVSKILLLLMNQILNVKKIYIYSVWINKNKKHIDRLPKCNELFLVINPKSLGLWADGCTGEAIWRSDLDYFPLLIFWYCKQNEYHKIIGRWIQNEINLWQQHRVSNFAPFFPLFFPSVFCGHQHSLLKLPLYLLDSDPCSCRKCEMRHLLTRFSRKRAARYCRCKAFMNRCKRHPYSL